LHPLLVLLSDAQKKVKKQQIKFADSIWNITFALSLKNRASFFKFWRKNRAGIKKLKKVFAD
jgi:hypothetical protein